MNLTEVVKQTLSFFQSVPLFYENNINKNRWGGTAHPVRRFLMDRWKMALLFVRQSFLRSSLFLSRRACTVKTWSREAQSLWDNFTRHLLCVLSSTFGIYKPAPRFRKRSERLETSRKYFYSIFNLFCWIRCICSGVFPLNTLLHLPLCRE